MFLQTLVGANFSQKMSPFDQIRAPEATAWRTLDQDLISILLEKEVTKAQEKNISHFMEAIAYEKYKVGAEQYHRR